MKKSYSELLTEYIENSGLSYAEIVLRVSKKGINIHKSYISKLKNGTKPPATDDLNRAIAEVTGGDPEELIVAAYLEKAPEEVKDRLLTNTEQNTSNNMEQEISENQLHAFSFRLKAGLKEKNLAKEDFAEKCNVTVDYINKLLDKPKKLPGISTLYKLAELIEVTPDYLGGYTDNPKGTDTRTPRPRDMEEFLTKEEVMFDGKILSEDDKEKITNVLAAIFMDAKKKNRRS
ncbi:helix-turn-helix transcriptional regulator [Schinkia azotoformans]|uniref:helix-turn-helix transcriptional regulator n=1 Tax=Schinkia azotoformans TaxID=1454 RepID=UPI002E22968D|nr:helix-turn-helix transcriptional regulator [Schinkia azotoformans]